MYPIIFAWGNLVLPAWHVLYVIAAVAAFIILKKLKNVHYVEMTDSDLSRMFIIAYVFAYFGARLFAILVEQPQALEPSQIVRALFELGPMTMYGGLLGCFFSALVFALWRKFSIPVLADISFIAGIFAVGVGRIGCFLNGDDYGIPANITNGIPWWAVTFPNHEDPVPRYPVQLFEALFCFSWSLLLISRMPKIRRYMGHGVTAALAAGGYGFFRFFNEYLRDDARGWVIDDVLSPAQFVSLIILGCSGTFIALRLSSKGLLTRRRLNR